MSHRLIYIYIYKYKCILLWYEYMFGISLHCTAARVRDTYRYKYVCEIPFLVESSRTCLGGAIFVGAEVLMRTAMRNTVLYVVQSRSSGGRFGGTYPLHLLSWKAKQKKKTAGRWKLSLLFDLGDGGDVFLRNVGLSELHSVTTQKTALFVFIFATAWWCTDRKRFFRPLSGVLSRTLPGNTFVGITRNFQ
jgi:hypothetical protein